MLSQFLLLRKRLTLLWISITGADSTSVLTSFLPQICVQTLLHFSFTSRPAHSHMKAGNSDSELWEGLLYVYIYRESGEHIIKKSNVCCRDWHAAHYVPAMACVVLVARVRVTEVSFQNVWSQIEPVGSDASFFCASKVCSCDSFALWRTLLITKTVIRIYYYQLVQLTCSRVVRRIIYRFSIVWHNALECLCRTTIRMRYLLIFGSQDG